MDVERKKAKRTTVRTLFSKLVTKIENTIRRELSVDFTIENKIDELHSLKNQLLDKIKELNKLDEEIEGVIGIKELEQELIANDKYKETGISLKTKIDRCIIALEKQSNPIKQNEPLHNVESNYKNENRIKNESSLVKLPRINISTFNGDCSDWLDFWNSYEVAIHANDSLSNIEKFAYLKTYLKGTALTAVSGFAITEQNYDSCISLLKERFGRTDLIISCHMNKLLLVDSVKTVHNVAALRKMYDAIEIQVRSLESLGVAAGTYSSLLSPIILQKLPDELNLLYNRQRKTKELFDIKDLIEFLRKEIECRETSLLLGNQRNSVTENVNHKPVNNYNYSKTKYPYYPKRNIPTTSALISTVENRNCIFCSKPHMNQNCNLNASERKKSLLGQGRCFACMGRRHTLKNCWKKNNQPCRNCNQLHKQIWLICENDKPKQSSAPEQKPSETITLSENSLSLFCNENKIKENNSESVYLQTFTAIARSRQNWRQVHCLIDGGATRSFIKRDVADSLKLPVLGRETLLIYAFGNRTSEKQTYDLVEIELQNIFEAQKRIKIKAIVIDYITQGQIEVPSTHVRKLALQEQIKLADVGNSTEIHLLIGSDYIWDILRNKNVRISKRLVATDSIFGFVIQGRDVGSNLKEVQINHITVVNEEFGYERVKRLWELEAIGINSEKEVSRSDKEILESFEQNTTYENKRYETRLLWKEGIEDLDSNYEIAKRRLINLNNKLEKNEDLYVKYKEIIQEHLKDGIVEPVDLSSNEIVKTGYYMPHHAVVREEKDSTKVRIVFDASSKGKGNLSLNDCLDSGPNLNPDLLKILIKFRVHAIAFCADIQRAFLEVGIAKEDREFLKFLWLNDEGPILDHNFPILRHSRVPFGVKCSPYLLTATIRLHLKGYEKAFEEACNMLRELYVDDLISGTADVFKALNLTKNMISILADASMNLRKWVSNSPELSDLWRLNNIDCRETSDQSGVNLKVLGLIWDNVKDNLRLDVSPFEKLQTEKVTKRIILAACGMLFDPLGIMNPFTVKIKLLMQTMWEKGIDWDEGVPLDIESALQEWVKEVKNIKCLEVPRQYFSDPCWKLMELHIFSDASPKCYGAVAYFRTENKDGYKTSFVISKSRLAPLKRLTLPRLELMGTLISARLGTYLQSIFPMLKREKIFYWTDSQICIHWIKGNTNEWKQFIRNRVIEIKEKTYLNNWNFCNGKENPADKLTRGMKAKDLIDDKVWFSGPPWLSERNISCYTTKLNSELDLQNVSEERKCVSLTTYVESAEPLINIELFSNLDKVLRVTAYVLRFVNNCIRAREKKYGKITADELRKASELIIKNVQLNEFVDEIKALKAGKPIKTKSKIIDLNPFIDENEILRVGGRLGNALISEESKHPVILPKNNHLTKLIIRHFHEKHLHGGLQLLLSAIRQKYWIISARGEIKKCIWKCIKCCKVRASTSTQLMGELPSSRVVPSRTFSKIGIDFAGPFAVKMKRGRGIRPIKCYVCIFVCLATKAIHLEIVSDLSSEAFLAALKRFASRRGKPQEIRSDCGTNFIGANKILKEVVSTIQVNEEFQRWVASENIEWKFNPPASPHHGGIWEAAVKSMKLHLKKTLGIQILTYEEFLTLLVQVEACLNSRPLTPVSSDPNDLTALTPGHFIIGTSLTAVPEQDLTEVRVTPLQRWRLTTQMFQGFWKRWSKEYLSQLQQRSKWRQPTRNIKKDDLVLIKDDNLPSLRWKLGRVMEVFPGKDNNVRVVKLKTLHGELKRPITKLCKLPIDETDD